MRKGAISELSKSSYGRPGDYVKTSQSRMRARSQSSDVAIEFFPLTRNHPLESNAGHDNGIVRTLEVSLNYDHADQRAASLCDS